MSTTNIAFNGRFLSRQPTGVDRFAEETIRAIDKLIDRGQAPGWLGSCRILAPRGSRQLHLSHVPHVESTSSRQGTAWEQLVLPGEGSGFLLVNLCNTAPVAIANQVCAIHDAATRRCPQSFSRSFRLWYAALMPLLGYRARGVLTVSEFSRADLIQAFRIPPSKIRVVVEGADHMARFEPDLSFHAEHGLTRPYVLAVSSQAPHKNFKLILNAIAQLDNPGFDVVIAGGANARVFASGGKGDMQAQRSVRWVGYVSNQALRALYQKASAFVFPSIYEGFGIPPLEAMHEGCPVIASNTASMPEVCGDAALYIDPQDAKGLADAMVRLVSDRSLADHLRAKGRQRVSQFTWEAAARGVLSSIQSFLHGGDGR